MDSNNDGTNMQHHIRQISNAKSFISYKDSKLNYFGTIVSDNMHVTFKCKKCNKKLQIYTLNETKMIEVTTATL
jgi:hypothetical protein